MSEFNLDGGDNSNNEEILLGGDGDDFVIDFSDVKEDLLPPGKYTAEIVSCKPGVSKSGNRKLDVRWKVTSGNFTNRQILDMISIHPNRLAQVKKVMMALGVSDGGMTRFSANDLIGKVATITLDIEKGKGSDENGEPYADRNRVKAVRKLSGLTAADVI